MKKFVPRQRKHKAIARQKEERGDDYVQQIDSNAIEHVPASKAAIIEKKRQLKEELRNGLPQVSGKKAKRLEKYIETKLKKDENRELIEKLAKSRTDTSLYQSSSRLGQGKETKRQALSRALLEKQRGIDLDGNNDEILFTSKPKRKVEQAVSQSEDEDDEDEDDGRNGSRHGNSIPSEDFQKFGTNISEELSSRTKQLQEQQALPTVLGGGLKRPLELGDDGKPQIQKRQKRGGIKSKVTITPRRPKQPEEEPDRSGFSSASEMPTESENESDEELSSEDGDRSGSDESMGESEAESDSHDQSGSGEASGDESEESDPETAQAAKRERSSAFKDWANQQRNRVMGYDAVSNIQAATETMKIEGFVPREQEQDPLPQELLPSTNLERKAYSVTVNRKDEIQAVRMKLPVVGEEQKIMEAIHNNSTIVVYGATGSGKTTQIPQFLYEAGYGSKDSPTPGMIGVTQPRRVAAVSMAKRVGDELGDHGKKVAYQIRFEGTASSQTAIKFMTDGVLLREVAQDIALRKYSAIVIDEAHERSVNTDILIGMMSRVVKLREEMAKEDPSIRPLKLIIMSATLRITDFTENKTLFSTPPPVLQAEGRQYPVTNHFARKNSPRLCGGSIQEDC